MPEYSRGPVNSTVEIGGPLSEIPKSPNLAGQTYLSKSILVVMKNINLESNSSSMVNISHEILFVLRCLAYFWNSATLRELSKCILYQIHTEFFLIVEFSGPPNLAGQKDLLKTGESPNLAGRRIYRAMTVHVVTLLGNIP